MLVSTEDVKVGDVLRFEYGDYDNWVKAKVVDIKRQPDKNYDLAHFVHADYPDSGVTYDVCLQHGETYELV